MLTSLAAAMALLFSAIPKILGFMLIIVAGWFIASLIEKGLAALLRTIRFNELSSRAGLDDFVRKMGMNTDPAGMIGLVVKWFVRLIALVVAFDALGLPAVSEVLRQLLLRLPNVVVALVVEHVRVVVGWPGQAGQQVGVVEDGRWYGSTVQGAEQAVVGGAELL